MSAPILYDRIGANYATYRIPDARIAQYISSALGTSQSVVNVGAGTGSYEPAERDVVAVELSRQMIVQRPVDAAPVVQGRVEHLPFSDATFDASLAILTLHHWQDWKRGVSEMMRVAKHHIAILTWDPAYEGFWLNHDYFPEALDIDRSICPPLSEIQDLIGGASVVDVPVPWDCTDGFLGAYWRRPQAYLDAGTRAAISTFTKMSNVDDGLARLRADIDDGTWHARNGALRTKMELDVGYRLISARLGP